jgi:MYXO-CTERM domain-containing protein
MELKKLAVGLVAVAASSLALPAMAHTIKLELGSAVTVGDFTKYTYDVRLSSGNTIDPGTTFTLYDVSGYVDGTATFLPGASIFPGTFTLNDDLYLGPQYAGQPVPGTGGLLATDAAEFINITGTYAGSTYLAGLNSLGTFSFWSSVAQQGNLLTISNDTPLELAGYNDDTTVGPLEAPGGPGVITPTPAAASAGLGLLGLLGFSRRRTRKA